MHGEEPALLDLGRHLADEPVLARSPGRTYLLRKFVARHRVGVGAAAAMALIAAAAVVAQGLLSWRPGIAVPFIVAILAIAAPALALASAAGVGRPAGLVLGPAQWLCDHRYEHAPLQ